MDATTTTKPRRRRRKLTAAGLSDFRFGVDHVVRISPNRAVVRDRDGLYADLLVHGDALTDDVRANLDKLDDRQAATMFEAVRCTPYLSPEGRRERMACLLASGKVRLSFVAERELAAPASQPDVFTMFEASP